MELLLCLPAAAAMAALLHFAVSRQSSRAVRRGARIALILAGLSILVCSVLLIFRPGATAGAPPAVVPDETPPPPAAPGDWKSLVILAAAAIIFVVIITLALRREQGRSGKQVPEPPERKTPP